MDAFSEDILLYSEIMWQIALFLVLCLLRFMNQSRARDADFDSLTVMVEILVSNIARAT